MPDPAVEAARVGLPYTEPTSHPFLGGKKGVKITHVRDPSNPLAPPKRVIEKMGFWERVFGGSRGQAVRPLPPVTARTTSSLAPFTQPRPLPSTITPASLAATLETHPNSTTLLRPTPFPLNFSSLPRDERKMWEKQRAEEIKYLRAVQKEQKAAGVAEGARLKREEKERKDKEKAEIKARQKAIKLEKKLGYRPLPQVTPTTLGSGALTTSSGWMSTTTPAQPSRLGQPTSWMLLPTLEEFGIRRPFDAPGPGRPEGLGGRKVDIGGTEWPMMSRTMTYALQDVAREERVRMDQAGHTWSPAWYRD